MATGTINGSTSNQFISAKLSYTATPNVAGNYSDISISLIYRRTNSGFTTQGTWHGAITIDGTEYAGTAHSITITQNADTVAMTATARIYHDADGSKSITISASGYISGTSLSSTTVSATISLDVIPRATTPSLPAASADFGTAITITLTPAVSSFRHTLTYTFGSASGTIGTNIATSKSWTIPASLASQIPNALSGVCTITAQTYSGATLIGEKPVMLTLTIPQSMVPVIAGAEIGGADAHFGRLIQNKSSAVVSFTASGINGSTPVSASVAVDGRTYPATIGTGGAVSVTSRVLLNAGSIAVTISLTDSRGRTASQTLTATVIAYSRPSVSALRAFRVDADGDADNDGVYLAIEVSAEIAPIRIGLTDRNTRFYTISYREYGDYDWLTVGTLPFPAFSWSGIIPWAGDDYPTFDINKSYDIKLGLTDYYGTVEFLMISGLPTSFSLVEFNASGRGLAIGKASEAAEKMEIALPLIFNGAEISHIEYGHAEMPFGPVGEHSVHVSFSRPFTQLPAVFTPAIFGTVNVLVSDEEISLTGFDALLGGPAGTSESTRGFSWIAIGV